jgi:sugar/nucleoside kinase (ribokinase family)
MTEVPAFDRVTVFGGITVDRIARTDAAAALGVSNPGTVRSSPGGVGFNMAASLARLGLRTRLVAIVGADADGESVLAAAKAAGVDVDRIVISRGRPTATYQAAIGDDGELVIGVADMQIYGELDPAAVAPAAAAGPEADDFWVVDANLMPETLAFLIGEANAARRPLAGLAVSPSKAARFAPLFDHLTYLFANRREAAAILGRAWDDKGPAPVELADEIRRGGCANVVVTNAREPLAAVAGSDMRAFAPLKATVRTVNGAGDALSAGTVYGLAQGRGLFEAIRFGLALSALTIESDETVRSDLTPTLLAERIGGGVR